MSATTNRVDSYVYANQDVLELLQTYLDETLRNNVYLPDPDESRNFRDDFNSFYHKLFAIGIEPWRTFIYLKNSNDDNFLYYLDSKLFGDQTDIVNISDRLQWFRTYRKENSQGISLLNSQQIRQQYWNFKTESEKTYLFLNNKEATLQDAYTYFRRENRLRTLTGTILGSYEAFEAKWKELLQIGYEFQTKPHHPVFDGTHVWNSLPISLRRKWGRGDVVSTDPFLLLVNCCIAPILHDFFNSNPYTWLLYNSYARRDGVVPDQSSSPFFGHSSEEEEDNQAITSEDPNDFIEFQIQQQFSPPQEENQIDFNINDALSFVDPTGFQPTTFHPRYFRVPGPTTSCFYLSLPALWDSFHGYSEIEGLWKGLQYILERMTLTLRLPPRLFQSVTNTVTSNMIQTDTVQETIRNVDRSQRFLTSYTQTLNNVEQNQSGMIDQTVLTELGYMYHTSHLYNTSPFMETNRTICDETSHVITTDHTDARFTFRTRTLNMSIFNVNVSYIQTNPFSELVSNEFSPSNEDYIVYHTNNFFTQTQYHNFSTGMVDDPRVIQNQIFNQTNTAKLSFYKAFSDAYEYLVNMAPSQTEFQNYLNTFYPGAVPRTVNISFSTIGIAGSTKRINFLNNSIRQYIESRLRSTLQSNLNRVGSLEYRWDIHALNFNDQNIIVQNKKDESSIIDTLDTPNLTPFSQSVINTIQNRHTTELGMITSTIHTKASIQTPFSMFDVSPSRTKTTYDFTDTPYMPPIMHDWNHSAILPCSYSQEFGTVGSYTNSRRYERSGYSPQRIRRPITYGESVDMWKHHATNDALYSAVGDPITIIGNYGLSYMESVYPPEIIPTQNGISKTILDLQPVVKDALFRSYFSEDTNLDTLHSVLPKTIHLPMVDILSNDIDDIIPRSITGDTFLELLLELEPFSNYTTEWSSSRKRQREYLALESGNYYIRDTHPKTATNELEYKDPNAEEFEPSYYRSLCMDTIPNELNPSNYGNADPSIPYQQIYQMWNGLPIRTNHPECEIPERVNTVGDRTVFLDVLASYNRYRSRPELRRFVELNQITIDRGLVPHFNYFGFSFTPEFNKELFDSQSFMRRFKQIQSIDNVQLTKQKDSIKVDTTKQVFDIRFDATLGTDITLARGIDDEPIRIMYIESNPPKYLNPRMNESYHKQRFLDGGGLWLGTNSIALRYSQYGKDPNTIQDIEIPINLTQATLDATPQFDTNFRLSDEPQFPVLVEYPSIWNGVHGTFVQQDRFAPYIKTVERPSIRWSSSVSDEIEQYNPHLFRSILFDVSGDEIGPKLDQDYYHTRFSYEHFHRVTEPNIYGIQFGLGYWDRQPLGYLDFGATTNTSDRFFRFETDQRVSRVNTNLEKSITLNFDLTWQNILYSRDGLLYTRYLR